MHSDIRLIQRHLAGVKAGVLAGFFPLQTRPHRRAASGDGGDRRGRDQRCDVDGVVHSSVADRCPINEQINRTPTPSPSHRHRSQPFILSARKPSCPARLLRPLPQPPSTHCNQSHRLGWKAHRQATPATPPRSRTTRAEPRPACVDGVTWVFAAIAQNVSSFEDQNRLVFAPNKKAPLSQGLAMKRTILRSRSTLLAIAAPHRSAPQDQSANNKPVGRGFWNRGSNGTRHNPISINIGRDRARHTSIPQ